MSSAVLALAAGAIGSVVTLLGTGSIRFLTARYEVAAHDQLVADLDEDLERWIADDHVRLKRELRELRNDLNARNLFYSGEYGYQLGLAKERALQAYRDQETRARREAALIRERETWMHAFWRKKLNAPLRRLATPTKAKPVLDAWRLPPSRHLSLTDSPPAVDDPSKRQIDDILVEVQTNTEDFI